MDNQIYHLVYLTTNLINGKIYIGKHSTYNSEDNYLGSGSNLKKAIKKYGKENFRRDILYYCLTSEESEYIESQIVDVWFLKRKDTYNLVIGGNTPYIEKSHKGKNRGRKIPKEVITKRLKTFKENYKKENHRMYGKHHSLETINKMSESSKGEKNGMHKSKKEEYWIEFSEKIKRENIKIGVHKIATKEYWIEFGRAHSKENNYNARLWRLTSPLNEVFMIKGNIQEFCDNLNLNYRTLERYLGITYFKKLRAKPSKYNNEGWKLEKLN